MSSILADALAGNASLEAIIVLTLAHLAFWTLLYELVQPRLRGVLSLLGPWAGYQNCKVGATPVLDDAARGLLGAAPRWAALLLAAAAPAAGAARGPALLRWGVACQVAADLNDALWLLLGHRQHAGTPLPVKVFAVLRHGAFALALGLGAALPGGGADADLRWLCLVLLSSGAFLTSLVPLQYAVNLKDKNGSQRAFLLQGLNLLVFVLCRFALAIMPFPGAYVRMLRHVRAVSSEWSYVVAAGFATAVLFDVALVVALMGRLKKARAAAKQVRNLRTWFANKQKDTPEEEVVKHVWEKARFDEALIRSPVEMMAVRWKARGGKSPVKKKGL